MSTMKKSVTERSRTAMADRLNPRFSAVSFSKWGTWSADLLIGGYLVVAGDTNGLAVREEVGAERHDRLAGLHAAAKQRVLGTHVVDLHRAEADRHPARRQHPDARTTPP